LTADAKIARMAVNLNETMLFRWMGYGIEQVRPQGLAAPSWKPLPAIPHQLSQTQRESYLDLLRAALDPSRGVRVSSYDPIDRVGDESPLVEPQPCLFFTEQAASSSADHWRLYGRLGLGFSKRAIFREGGRPVIYSGGKDDPIQKSVAILRKHLRQLDSPKAQRALEFLARFVKTTRVPKPMTSVREENPTPQARIQESRKQAKPATKLNPMAFPPEKPIAYLQEREWRLVKPEKPGKAWCVDSDGVSWFRPRVGHDLQLVVLPDNETLRLAIECEFIRNRLVLPDRPPLQLISSELLRRI
jgi:hypothetical protein